MCNGGQNHGRLGLKGVLTPRNAGKESSEAKTELRDHVGEHIGAIGNAIDRPEPVGAHHDHNARPGQEGESDV